MFKPRSAVAALGHRLLRHRFHLGVLYADVVGPRAANAFAVIWSWLIGLIDFVRRLRATRYPWINPAGGEACPFG